MELIDFPRIQREIAENGEAAELSPRICSLGVKKLLRPKGLKSGTDWRIWEKPNLKMAQTGRKKWQKAEIKIKLFKQKKTPKYETQQLKKIKLIHRNRIMLANPFLSLAGRHHKFPLQCHIFMPNILLHWFNLFQACFKNYMGFQSPEKKSADEIKEKKNWGKKTPSYLWF